MTRLLRASTRLFQTEPVAETANQNLTRRHYNHRGQRLLCWASRFECHACWYTNVRRPVGKGDGIMERRTFVSVLLAALTATPPQLGLGQQRVSVRRIGILVGAASGNLGVMLQ